jgi:2-hydroxychromene-2-carboxylate isomerase
VPAFVRAVYRANFADDRDITSPDVVASILTSLGRDATATIAAAQAPEVKMRLREQTEEAGRLGIFGAPTVVVDGELFWGNDRLEDAVAWRTAVSARAAP